MVSQNISMFHKMDMILHQLLVFQPIFSLTSVAATLLLCFTSVILPSCSPLNIPGILLSQVPCADCFLSLELSPLRYLHGSVSHLTQICVPMRLSNCPWSSLFKIAFVTIKHITYFTHLSVYCLQPRTTMVTP